MLVIVLVMIISLLGAGAAWADVYNAKNVISDMNSAAYWIIKAQNTSTVLLTAAEIQALNNKIYGLGATYARDMTKYPETVNGDALADEIDAFAPDKKLYDEGSLVDEDYFDDIHDNMDAGGLNSEQEVEWGVCVKNTAMKSAPIPKILSDEADDWAYDDFQNSTLLVNEPVAILHESDDGEWYWVAMYNCNGWVKASDVAKCNSHSQWVSLQNPTSFLMVTANEFQLDANIYTTSLSELTLSMGTKLPLATMADADGSSIDGRLPYGNYVVKIPTRDSNGLLEYKLALIPMSKDVHVGYLPYTTANVLNQAFKMLGDRYGWGGTLAARDCSMFTMDIYRTFGINLPRNTTGQAKTPGKITDLTAMNTAAKTTAIAGLRPGSLLQMPGHIMIYLGKVGDRLYVISAAGTIGVAQTGSATPAVIKARGTFVNDLTMLRSTGATWLDSMTTAVEIPATSSTPTTPTTPTEVEVVKNPFNDIGNSPYYDSIVRLAADGVINGRTATTFAPADKITRGEFATVLSRAFNLEQDKAYAESMFKDVKNYPLAGYVGAVAKAKFMTGIATNLFTPKAQLSYKDTKAMLWKVLNQEVSDSATAESILESVGADLAGTGAISREEIAHAVDELLQSLAQLQ